VNADRARRALVTGAARGIGAAIAQRLRDDGFEVVTLDVAPGCDLQVDLAEGPLDDPAFGDIDAVVSNAAITTTIAPAHRMTEEQWRRDIDVNLTGAFRVVQACLPGMRERGYGRIVAISSGAATGGLPGQVAYSASKAGLLGMVRTLATEGARHGITANAVLPGMIATEAGAGDARTRARARPRRTADGADGGVRGGRARGRVPVLGASGVRDRPGARCGRRLRAQSAGTWEVVASAHGDLHAP
jgi:NAD(P)-dependent dehydrogenase (short-subunit alcohol dehydrogenase family)